jgi:putative two-component system response regulator
LIYKVRGTSPLQLNNSHTGARKIIDTASKRWILETILYVFNFSGNGSGAGFKAESMAVWRPGEASGLDWRRGMENIRSKIIIVDDNMANLTMGRNILKTFYEVYPAPSAAKLFELLENNVRPDLILLDVEMPETNGYEAIKKLKSDPELSDIPVIFLTAKNDETSELEGFDLGAVDYISKPFSGPRLLKRIASHLLIVRQKKDLLANQAELKNYADNLEVMVREKTREVFNLQNAVLSTVADLVEFRDKFTGGHVARTQLYLKALTDELIREEIYREEISEWDMTFFLPSSQLHDVGKIAITDLILNKPGKLTEEEFEIMKTHVPAGVNAIKKIMSNTEEHAFLRHTLSIAENHHEKWDGSGYPTGLKGLDIPLEGRLMAIADVYDALISERPYKKAFTHEEASKIIEAGSGTHFDPVLVDVFRNVKSEFARVAQEVKETG